MRKIKQKKIKEKPVTLEENYQAKTMFIIIIIILVLLVPLYFITNLVLDNNKSKQGTSENNNPVEIQSEKILVGQLLNRHDSSYYVIAYKNDDKMTNLINQYIYDYKQKEEHLNFYKIDLNDGLNKGYISDTTNITDDLKDLKISDTTLFVIKDGKIDNYYVGNNDVIDALKELKING